MDPQSVPPSDTVRAFADAWSRLDLDRVIGLLHPDICYHNIPLEPLSGKDEVEAYLRAAGPFEWCRWTLREIAATGDRVLTERVDEMVVRGTKIVLPVMGGSQGIGLACAQLFHAEGANVTIAARGKQALEEAAHSMPGCRAATGDVTNSDDLKNILAVAGDVEVLINNAGGPPAGTIESLTDEQWHSAIQLTLMSAVRATQLVLPAMRRRNWGRIVNISSYGVKQPVPTLSLSNSVRMAVLGWAKTLARQVADSNITVNTVCPGWTRTDRVTSLIAERAGEGGDRDAVLANIVGTIPLGRLGEPEDVANLVAFLASDAAAYITGTAIQVDGGLVEGYA